MDVDRLSKDELTYELMVRGVKEDTSTSVSSMRSTLRKLLKLEEGGQLTLRSPLKLDCCREMIIIKEKLAQISSWIESGEAKKNTNFRRKVDTCLLHVMNRLGRVESDETIEEKSKCLKKTLDLYELLENLDTKADKNIRGESTTGLEKGEPREVGPPRTDLFGEEDNSFLNEQEGFPPKDLSRGLSTLRVTDSAQVIRKQVPVSQWHLKFSGDDCGTSLHGFLEDVEHYRRARNTSYQDLYDGAIDFFAGPALLWYKSIRQDIRSWKELESLLREEFEGEDFEDELLREIMARTQGPEEKFTTFVAVMKTYFSRLPSLLSEEKKVRILIKNSTPYFYGKLQEHHPRTVDEVLKVGRRIQRDKEHMASYRPPPSSRKYLLEPDLAYKGPRKEEKVTEMWSPSTTSSQASSSIAVCQDTGRRQKPPPGYQHPPVAGTSCNRSTRTGLTCWHCKQEGHRYQTCPSLRLKFCTRCGRDILPDGACPNCRRKVQKNLNTKTGRM